MDRENSSLEVLGNDENLPVYIAAARGYDKALKVMLGRNPSLVDCLNKRGVTPLFLASEGEGAFYSR